jgi:hypothetical protein
VENTAQLLRTFYYGLYSADRTGYLKSEQLFNGVMGAGSIALGALACLGLAAGSVCNPLVAAAASASVLAVLAGTAPSATPARAIVALVTVLLTGYAFCGRGFAYLGRPPIYVGEIALVLACIIGLTAGTFRPTVRAAGLPLLVFMAWSALRTVPGIVTYGLDALRDAAVWGYALFALALAGALVRLGDVRGFIRWYRVLLTPLLVWFFLLGLVRAFNPHFEFPAGPAGVPLVVLKPGDTAVHLSGIAAFLALRLHRLPCERPPRTWLRDWQLWALWTGCFLLHGSQNRGGLLGLLTSLLFLSALLHKGTWTKPAALLAIVVAAFTAFEFEIPAGLQRKATPEQIVENLRSVAGSDDPRLEGTRRWRLQWWRTILGYTVQGEYFWIGKGFGSNLADEDGFQVTRDRSLRSPHNGHLTILARTGVPGFVLWWTFLTAHGIMLVRSARQAKDNGDTIRSKLFLWLLTYSIAATINAASDVYLEGPQGGIWFWCLIGVARALFSLPGSQHPLRAMSGKDSLPARKQLGSEATVAA